MCTLARPTRNPFGEAEIRVPEDAPAKVRQLVVDCLKGTPEDRPTIDEVCQRLDEIEAQANMDSSPKTPHSNLMEHASQASQ